MKKVLLFLLFPLSVFAQKNYTASLDSFITEQVKNYGFSGTALVMQKNNVVLKKE